MAACRDDQQPAGGAPRSETVTAKLPPPAPTPADYDAILSRILALQDAIRNKSSDLTLIPPLVTASFDTVTGSFRVVGKGVPNPKSPEATWNASRKTAAKSDALRWVLYLKAWRMGNMKAFGTRISGEIMYSTVLYERQGDDTLCQLVEVPIGSVVLK
jgi:hypothetical protein